MKSSPAVRQPRHPNFPLEFKLNMVERSYQPGISVAQLARENGINDNLLFKWRQFWREGKLRPPDERQPLQSALVPVVIDDAFPAGNFSLIVRNGISHVRSSSGMARCASTEASATCC